MKRRGPIVIALLVVVAAAVTAVVVQAADSPTEQVASAQPTTEPVQGPDAPPGSRAVSYRGVQVFVPEKMTANGWNCGRPSTDTTIGNAGHGTVVVGAPPRRCVEGEYGQVDASEVHLYPADTGEGERLALTATTPTRVNGTDAFTDCATCTTGPFADGSILYFPDQRVVLTASVFGTGLNEQIFRTARVVDTDVHGCATRRTGPTPSPGANAASAWDASAAVVPAGIDVLVACFYDRGLSQGSARIEGFEAEQMLGRIARVGEWPEDLSAPCTSQRVTPGFDIIELTADRADGTTTQHTVVINACRPYVVPRDPAGSERTVLAARDGVEAVALLRGS
jgi:quercetin dioxygenase-like cupin family protein